LSRPPPNTAMELPALPLSLTLLGAIIALVSGRSACCSSRAAAHCQAVGRRHGASQWQR
jgi:hypothetical protein